MLWKKFIKGLSYTLMIGACLILGFLSFSGVYILAPILPLAIVVFFLAVLFEGEIYYQNISKAIKSLLKPKYLESKVAEDCLYEVVLDLQNTEELIEAINEFQHTLEDLTKNEEDVRKSYNKMSKQLAKHQKESKNPKIQQVFSNTNFLTAEELEYIIKERQSAPKLTFAKWQTSRSNTDSKTQQAIQSKKTLFNTLRSSLQQELDRKPQLIKDYERLSIISHKYSHLNLNKQGMAEKASINVGLSILEKVFAEQLFADKPLHNTDETDHESKQTPEERLLAKYKEELQTYLAERYQAEYTAKLKSRRPFSIFNKILSTICGTVMIVGTSYLLVEAFTLIPLLSAIPFGFLPIVVVPLSIIAGAAYGIITYRALDEMLNNDVITKRWNKIKEDWKNGLTLYTGGKLVGFLLLLTLAIVLTICTGGTWYTVVKHTKPIFSWLSKMPSAISGVIAGFLAVGALAFNSSNSLQTGEEIEEYFENEVPEDHHLNIDLLTIEEGLDINDRQIIDYTTKRTAIIKQGNDYYIHCCNKGYKERHNIDNWERIKVDNNSYLAKQLNKLKFANNVLYYNAKNSLIYNLIRLNTAHKFKASNENRWQYFNPFRMLLYVTYVPLKFIFFIGHLVSISATADRIPGIPEVISMFVGFVAELFEDLHYFAGIEHQDRHDTASIVEERLKGSGEHDHNNDLPSRILRDYLFIPLFWLAAHYHSWASDRVNIEASPEECSEQDEHTHMRADRQDEEPEVHILDRLILNPIKFIYNKLFCKNNIQPTHKPSLSFEHAYAQMKHIAPKSKPQLDNEDTTDDSVDNDASLIRGANGINMFIDEQMQEHKQKVLDKDDLVEMQATNDKFLKILLSRPRASNHGIFANHAGCYAPNAEPGVLNRVLPVH